LELGDKLNQDPRQNDTLGKPVMSNTVFNAGDQVNSIPAKQWLS